MNAPDPYDRAIAYLTEHPEEINYHWDDPFKRIGGVLFRFASPTGTWREYDIRCGCLSTIRRGEDFVYSDHGVDDLTTTEIRFDLRIPANSGDITPADLPVFAEWQRKLDARWPGRLEAWERWYAESQNMAGTL